MYILCVEPIHPQYSGVLETCLALRYWFFEVLGSESVNTSPLFGLLNISPWIILASVVSRKTDECADAQSGLPLCSSHATKSGFLAAGTILLNRQCLFKHTRLVAEALLLSIHVYVA